MRYRAIVLFVLFAGSATDRAHGHGLMLPDDKKLPPLAMVSHRVDIAIEDQVSITKVEQVFRNHTDRQLEAVYVFPIPKGANVNKFTMWIDGREHNGELLDSKKATQIYTDIVRRTTDPAILEYIGQDLLRLKVFPIEPRRDVKLSLSYTHVAPSEGGLVEYVYPVRTDGKSTRTLEEFSVKATIRSQHPVQNVYSPTHAIATSRTGDKQVSVTFEKSQAYLDRDFQLFYSTGDKDIGITPMFWKPIASEDGYFMLLINPQLEALKNPIPRDMVLVLDTSGSMDATKMEQARRAMKHCLKNLRTGDRFGLVAFATNVKRYRDTLTEVDPDQMETATRWVDGLRAGGGTAIQSALDSALDMRSSQSRDSGRGFTVVFFTDGQPTIGEMKPENIVRSVKARNSDNTRIFTFGVGDDVNAVMLDQLAAATRATSSYVRPAEDIEVKASALIAKISHPVLASVRLTTSPNIRISEVYPPQLPDLFHGSQLVITGRYNGDGASAIKLSGQLGKDPKEYAWDVKFPSKATEGRDFVEQLWARHKVGFILDQIRSNGEQRELMDELMSLAKKYGIATPYTSHLVVPDAPTPVVIPRDRPAPLPVGGGYGGGLQPGVVGGFGNGPRPVDPAKGEGAKPRQYPVRSILDDYAKKAKDPAASRGELEGRRIGDQDRQIQQTAKGDPKKEAELRESVKGDSDALTKLNTYQQVRDALQRRKLQDVQSGTNGVNLSIYANDLRSQDRLTQTANRQVQGRNCLEVGGVWIDEGVTPQMKAVVVKAQSKAYFRILEKQPTMKDVYKLGNYLVFVTPANVALIIDTAEGKEELGDTEIDAMFAR